MDTSGRFGIHPRRVLGSVLVCACMVACTQLKPITPTASTPITTAATSPDAGFSGFPSQAPSSSPSPGASGTPGVTIPTPGPLGSLPPAPQPSFTPALITPLDPGATNGVTPAPPATGTASAQPGGSGAASPPALPGGATGAASPSPVPSPPASPPFPGVTKLNAQPIGIKHVGGAAVDASNNLWVGDVDTKTVKMFTLDGAIQGTFNVGGVPAALCFDVNGNLWVQMNDFVTLVELDRGGFKLRTVSLGAAGTDDPTANPGLAPLPDGGMWVLNGGGKNTAMHVDGLGKEVATVEGPGHIVTMASDAAGNVWLVINDVQVQLNKFSPTNTPLATVTDLLGIEDPKALVIDNAGNLWLAGRETKAGQPTQGTIVEFAGTGTHLGLINTGVDREPVAIAFDTQNNLALADGPAGSSHGHVGFQLVKQSGQIVDEQFYDAPDHIVEDRNGAFWGINSNAEIFRFKFKNTN